MKRKIIAILMMVTIGFSTTGCGSKIVVDKDLLSLSTKFERY